MGTAPSVVLIGFMGAGKSHVGRVLAARLGCRFTDTDALICERYGPIAEIFAQRGETAFRALERDVVLAALARAGSDSCVVSLGGGALSDADIRNALKQCDNVIWLSADIETLFSRVNRGQDRGQKRGAGHGTSSARVRPLAVDKSTFERLYEERRATYEGAATAIVVNDGGRSIDDVVDEMVAVLVGGNEREGQ